MARMKSLSPTSPPSGDGGRAMRGTPWGTTTMRSVPRISLASPATNWDGVWTQAPRSTARRSAGTIRRTSAVTISGNRAKVRSWTVTTAPAPRTGGTTKFVPWTTVAGASHRSALGWSIRPQAAMAAEAGNGSWRVPGGSGDGPGAGRERPGMPPGRRARKLRA
jgi:hypothetical protein